MNAPKSHWAALLRQLSYRLLPGQCLLCGMPSCRPADLCSDCALELPINDPACPVCALPMPTSRHRSIPCGACLANPPPYRTCTAALRYEFPVDRLINRFKHHGKFNAGAALADLLLERLHRQPALPELMVPVPLHWRRQWQRGFNQANWLAHYLGKRLAMPTNNRLLKRLRHTSRQQGQTRGQRLANLKGAFSLNSEVNGTSIALIDDVVTTGTTVREISRLLLDAGAISVDVWCLARTPLEK